MAASKQPEQARAGPRGRGRSDTKETLRRAPKLWRGSHLTAMCFVENDEMPSLDPAKFVKATLNRLRLRSCGMACWHRLLAIHTKPGPWGKCIVCFLTFGWGWNLEFGDQTMGGWVALDSLINHYGRHAVAAWLIAMGIIPIVGVVLNNLWINMVLAGIAMTSWLWLLFQAFDTGSLARAAVWTCAAGVIAFAKAEFDLVDLVVRGDQVRGDGFSYTDRAPQNGGRS